MIINIRVTKIVPSSWQASECVLACKKTSYERRIFKPLSLGIQTMIFQFCCVPFLCYVKEGRTHTSIKTYIILRDLFINYGIFTLKISSNTEIQKSAFKRSIESIL